MLYREIIAVCSEIHTKHINTVCGQNVELLNVKLVVHTVTTRSRMSPNLVRAAGVTHRDETEHHKQGLATPPSTPLDKLTTPSYRCDCSPAAGYLQFQSTSHIKQCQH